MTVEQKYGGPAFPQAGPTHPLGGMPLPADPGMSLRDWFASVALGALIALTTKAPDEDTALTALRGIPGAAYEIADAMLAARKQSEKPE